jgi:hypothetical protein
MARTTILPWPVDLKDICLDYLRMKE